MAAQDNASHKAWGDVTADLLARLGFEDPAAATRKADRDKVLADLAAGRITVDQAETLLVE